MLHWKIWIQLSTGMINRMVGTVDIQMATRDGGMPLAAQRVIQWGVNSWVACLKYQLYRNRGMMRRMNSNPTVLTCNVRLLYSVY